MIIIDKIKIIVVVMALDKYPMGKKFILGKYPKNKYLSKSGYYYFFFFLS